MAATFVVVPQWQGSGSSRAMRLIDGADAIRGDLPTASTRVVEIPLEAGDSQGTGVHRLSSVSIVRERFADAVTQLEGTIITVGGDCGVELGAIEQLSLGEVAIVWLDAHPDLNTPQSSPSGAFAGMVLRTLLGEGPEELVPSTPLDPARVVLAGVRSIDPGESLYLEDSGIPIIAPEQVNGASLVAAVEATGATSVYLHIDLDVIDPEDLVGLSDAEPFGVRANDLVAAIKQLLERFPLAGAGITQFAPASPQQAVDDLPTILRLVGALAAAS